MAVGQNCEEGHGFSRGPQRGLTRWGASRAIRRRAVARHLSCRVTRATCSAFTSHDSGNTYHAPLPDTAERVETQVSHRKQRTEYASTRHTSLCANERQILDVFDCQEPAKLLNAPVHATAKTPRIVTRLIGTPIRLETHVSRRKQSTACTSNRYSSLPPDLRPTTYDHHDSRTTDAIFPTAMKHWIKRKVHAYEKMRFDQEPIRTKLPFEWGLEHIGGDADGRDPRGYLDRFVAETIAESDAWFRTPPAEDYRLDGNVLTFTSAIQSPWAENNRVHGQFFPATRRKNGNGAGAAKGKGRAVVVLAQWNAKWEEQQGVCKWLNRLGITAVKISLPYHDRRAIPGHRRADHLVAPNIGLTLQANRQAVMDVRATLRWLERQGYDRLGILGTSIGSCIGFITMCHEPALRAGAFLHASTYFGDVVANGLTTVNVWEQLAGHVTPEELRRYWSPISPTPYLHKLPGRDRKMLLITGKYDPTFWPEFTEELLENMRAAGVEFASLRLPCGHYSLGITPFKEVAGYRFGRFLAEALG
jgi:hypothetical protein